MRQYYQYQAIDVSGCVVSGSQLSLSQLLVRFSLRLRRLKPLMIVPSLVPVLSKKQRQDFFSQLSMLLEASIPLLQSLEFLQANYINTAVASIIKLAKEQILKGQAFSVTFKALNMLSEVQFYLLQAGEASGQLNLALRHLVLAQKASLKQKEALLNALRYPAFLVVASVVVIIIFVHYILPQFSVMFDSMQAALPRITVNILRFTQFIERFGGVIFFDIIGLSAASYVFYYASPKLRAKLDSALLAYHWSWPKIGHLISYYNQQQFFTVLALLLKAKVHLLASLDLIAKLLPNYCFQQGIKQVRANITGGLDLARALAGTKLFDEASVHLIRLGEETGQLTTMAQQLADYYSKQLTRLITQLSHQLEPIIIVFLGGVIGVLIVGMYLPIFRLGETVH